MDVEIKLPSGNYDIKSVIKIVQEKYPDHNIAVFFDRLRNGFLSSISSYKEERVHDVISSISFTEKQQIHSDAEFGALQELIDDLCDQKIRDIYNEIIPEIGTVLYEYLYDMSMEYHVNKLVFPEPVPDELGTNEPVPDELGTTTFFDDTADPKKGEEMFNFIILFYKYLYGFSEDYDTAIFLDQLANDELQRDNRITKWHKIIELYRDVLDPIMRGEHKEDYIKIIKCAPSGSTILEVYANWRADMKTDISTFYP